MKHKKEKTENRKALPKFFGIIVISALVGGVLGFLSGVVGSTNLPETIVQGIYRFLEVITPWSIWVISAVLLGVGTLKYRTAKRLFNAWDGEDEETVEQAEMQINWVILSAALTMILDFFFFAIGFQFLNGTGAAAFILSFILALVVMTVLQQKAVDLTRKINPEKHGSIYDMKFRKKWLSSCDENEQRQIGQAAFKSFNAVTYTCLALWAVLVMMNYVLDVGILPIFLVMLIWGVSQVAYIIECIRMGRHKK